MTRAALGHLQTPSARGRAGALSTPTVATPSSITPQRHDPSTVETFTRPVRVAIGHDCDLVTSGLRSSLAPFSAQVEVVDFEKYVRVGLDILLQDPGVPISGCKGWVDLTDIVTAGFPRLVAFSWDTRPHQVHRAMSRGAMGYLSKELPAALLVEALQMIGSGTRVAVDAHGNDITLRGGLATQELPGRLPGLNGRESQVLTLIATGMSNQEIAGHCYLSINSVKTYIRTAYRKIGVTRRSQAVGWALRHGPDSPDGARHITEPGARSTSAWVVGLAAGADF